MKAKNRKTLNAIFETPTRSDIAFSDIEALVRAREGGKVIEREGSRVKIMIGDAVWRCHRPHSGKEAKKYQVEEARIFLENAGVTPKLIDEEKRKEAAVKGKQP
jgi:hypothetical protein